MVQLRRTAANAAAYDMDCELLTPAQALDLWPVIDTGDLLGAIWLPGDGKVNPTDVTHGARQGCAAGAGPASSSGPRSPASSRSRTARGRRVRGCGSTGGGRAPHRGRGGRQLRRPVGQGARRPGGRHGAVALGGALLRGDRADGGHPPGPADPARPRRLDLLQGGGRRPRRRRLRARGEAVALAGHDPYPFEFQLLEEDWDHFSVLMDEALRRIPALADTGIRKFYNGPESFTPDNQFLMGEAPGLDGFFVGAGFNSVGIASAGGAGTRAGRVDHRGRAVDGPVAVDLRRFAPFHGDNRWLRDRVAEVLGLHYAVPWPNRELESARDVPARRSTTAWPRPGRCSGRRWAGSGRTSSRRRPPRPDRLPGTGRTGSLVGRRAARHPRGGGRLRPDVVLQVRRVRSRRARGAPVVCANDVDVAVGTACTRRCSTGAGPTSRT